MKEKIDLIFKKMGEDHVSEFSAQCSYFMILAFIPFLILLLTLIQYTGISQETIYNILSAIIPDTMNDMIIGIVQEVYSKSIGTISISLVFTLWAAGKGLYALIKGLDHIYEIKDEPFIYLRARSIINTVIFLFSIVLELVLLVFGHGIVDTLKHELNFFDVLFWNTVEQLGLILFTFVMYLVIFKFIPKHKVSLKSQVPGALIGSLGLNIVSFIFSRYLVIFKGFSVMYGSLTTIMLIIMWTYTCIYTLFLGAEINKLIKLLR